MEASPTPLEKQIIKILNDDESPWDIFVSRPDFPETIPGVPNRNRLLEEIAELCSDKSNSLIVPIISDIGVGKTHFLWSIHNSFIIDSMNVFFKLPSADAPFYYSLYTQLIKNIDIEMFRDALNLLADSWGANEKKYGLFRIVDHQKVINNAKVIYKEKSKRPSELYDCISVVVQYCMDVNKYGICERWLLGDFINADDLNLLGIKRDLSAPYMAKEMLSLVVEAFQSGIVIMIDDFIKSANRYDEEILDLQNDCDGYDDYDDYDNLDDCKSTSKNIIVVQQPELQTSDNDGEDQKRIHDRLVEMITEFNGIKILITMHLEDYGELQQKIPDTIRENMYTPFTLQPFSREDMKWFYRVSMEMLCRKHRLRLVNDNPFFPLNEEMLDKIYTEADGNPRMIIKRLKNVTDAYLSNF